MADNKGQPPVGDVELAEASGFLPNATTEIPGRAPEIIKTAPIFREGLRQSVLDKRPPLAQSSDGDAMLAKKKPANNMTKPGSHSIVTQDTYPNYVYDCSAATGESDFLTMGTKFIGTIPENFIYQDHELTVQSTVIPFWIAQATRPGVLVASKAFEAFQAPPPPPAEITVKSVNFINRAIPVWKFEEAAISSFLIDRAPNSKALASALQSYLRPAKKRLIREAASAIRVGLIQYDNSSLYAKLIYWGLVLEYCETHDIATAAVPFAADQTVTTYALNALNIDVLDFIGSITTGRIILVDGEDIYTQQDLQVIFWLAKGGRRVNCARNERAPDMLYLNWPEIPIGLYVWQDHIPVPVAAIIPSETLFSFAYRLATKRSEWDALNKGTYLAMTMLGTRYTKPPTAADVGGSVAAAEREGAAAPGVPDNRPVAAPFVSKGLTTFLSAWDYELPRPQDYNVMLRGLNKLPPYKSNNFYEANRFRETTSKQRLNSCAFLTVVIRAMTTTTLTSFNISAGDIVRYFTNRQQSWFTKSIDDKIRCRRDTDQQPEILDLVFDMLKNCCGWTCYPNLYASGNWLGWPGCIADADMYYNDMVQTHPARLGSVLCIDNFLLCRPMEWGVLGPNTTVDFSANLLETSILPRRGFYAYLDRHYSEVLTSRTPFYYVVYGLQALNAIHQHFNLPGGAMYYSEGFWAEINAPRWALAAPVDDANYIANLHIFEPCTTLTFDAHIPAVKAPAMVGPAITDMMMRSLTNWKGQVIPEVGFELRRMSGSIMRRFRLRTRGHRSPAARKTEADRIGQARRYEEEDEARA